MVNARTRNLEANLARMRAEIVPRLEDYAAEMRAANMNTFYPKEQAQYADRTRAVEYIIKTYGEKLQNVYTLDRALELYIMLRAAYVVAPISMEQSNTALRQCAGFITDYVELPN
jgi:hypothetical protein